MLLSVKDVAEKYGYSSSQIRRLIRGGVIKATQLGAFYAIDESQVRFLKNRKLKTRKGRKGMTDE